MKGSVLPASVLVPLLGLAPMLGLAGCAGHTLPPSMPEWSPAEFTRTPSGPLPASATVLARPDVDEDAMRVPRDVEPKKIWPSSGLYVGGAIVTSQPMGDFDGDKAWVAETDVRLVPDLDVGAGGGVYVSYRWHMNELVVQYSITEHDGDFDGSPQEHDTTFYDLDFNWRHYFWENSPLQPYGIFGLGYSRAEIENGSTDQATGTVFEDAELEDGIVVNVGAGAALYTLPWVVFFGQGMYRFVRYETSDGIDGHRHNRPDVDGDGWNVSFGAAIRLLPPRN